MAPGPLRVEQASDRLALDTVILLGLLKLYADEQIVTEIECRVCSSCDVLLEDGNDEGDWFCDLCEEDLGDVAEIEVVFAIRKASTENSVESNGDQKMEVRKFMSNTTNEEQRAHVTPWAALTHDDFLVESSTLGDLEAQRILRNVEQYGICLFRLGSQTADASVIASLAKFIGRPSSRQNTYEGQIKAIRPAAGGLINSGDTTQDLGLHVDGTQHESQPAILIFQYVTEAKLGANSVFVDAAKVLSDLQESVRHRILVNLARPDAATFRKRGMEYQGPMITLSGQGVVCRLRFDEVIDLHPECKNDYEFLKLAFNQEDYPAIFKPREGDVIIFDNWRLLHGRDEVYGLRVREHNRMWITNLKPDLQSRILLGARPVGLATLAAIERANLGDC